MTRLLLEDVTVFRADTIVLQIRFKGGAARTLAIPLPPNAWQQRATSPEIVTDIDRLLDNNTDGQIAAILNERGTRSGEGKRLSRTIVARIRRDYSLTPRYDRLRGRYGDGEGDGGNARSYSRFREDLEPAWAASRPRLQRQE